MPLGAVSTSTVTVLVKQINRAPALLATLLNEGLPERSRVTQIPLAFTKDVSASLSVNDVILQNLSTGFAVSPKQMALSYDPASNRATLTFPGLPGQKLPDGNYRFSLGAAGVTDSDGKPLSNDGTFEFHVLSGDTNGDRSTNDLDLYRVWQNQLKPPAQRDRNADLNGDGQVTLADLAPVMDSYGKHLPAVDERLPGDANGDGRIDDLDLLKVWQELSKPETSRDLRYDFNADGKLDNADLAIVNNHYLQPRGP